MLLKVFLLAASVALVACIGVERVPFLLPPQPSEAQWAQVQHSAGLVNLTILHTGSVQVPLSGVLDKSDPKTAELNDKSLIVEVNAFWLAHPVYGNFFIDSGLDDRFQEGGQGSYQGLIAHRIVEDSFQAPGEDIGSQIRRYSIDLRGVFLTHIHGDHTAGIPAMASNVRVIASKEEGLHNYPLIMYNDHFDHVDQLEELDFDQGFAMHPFERVLDVFGDFSLLAIATPGHTAGNLSFLVHSLDGWVLLTGDASHTRWGFDNNVIPGWSESATQARVSLEALRKFSELSPDVRVIYGHEQ